MRELRVACVVAVPVPDPHEVLAASAREDFVPSLKGSSNGAVRAGPRQVRVSRAGPPN